MKYCTNCGNELRENAKFCEKCGTSRAGESTNQQVIQQPVNPQTQPPQKKSNKTLIIVLVVIGTCFLLGIATVVGLAVYLVYNNRIEELYDYDYDYNYDYDYGLDDLSAGNLYLKYPKDWKYIPIDDDYSKSIVRGDSSITISVVPTNMTEQEAGQTILNEMEQNGYLNGINSEVYLDEIWDKYIFSKDTECRIIIFIVKDNLLYKFDYISTISDYTIEKYDIEEIYYSIEIKELVSK